MHIVARPCEIDEAPADRCVLNLCGTGDEAISNTAAMPTTRLLPGILYKGVPIQWGMRLTDEGERFASRVRAAFAIDYGGTWETAQCMLRTPGARAVDWHSRTASLFV